MKNLIVFAGAGASRAIHPEQFPTTKEFFDRLPAEIKAARLFKFVHNYLKAVAGLEVVDIENILWEFRNLTTFCENLEKPQDIVGYALQGERLPRLMSSAYNLGAFTPVMHTMRNEVRELTDQINEVVYDLYAYQPEIQELEGNWSHLLRELSIGNEVFDIFTTNYDVAIEAALHDALGADAARERLGWSSPVQRRLKLSCWEPKRNSQGMLTKLHGSIDWKRRGTEIFAGDPTYTGDHSRHAIIYPGFKGLPEDPAFRLFHQYFGDRLADAKAAIFIGFAFRDDYINELIETNLSERAQVVVIDPSPKAKFPLPRYGAKMIRKGFNRESIHKALAEVSSKN